MTIEGARKFLDGRGKADTTGVAKKVTKSKKAQASLFPTDPAPPKIYRYSDRALGSVVTMCIIEMIGKQVWPMDKTID